MWLKAGPTKGRKTTDAGSSLGVLFPLRWIESIKDLSLQPFHLNILWWNINSPGHRLL